MPETPAAPAANLLGDETSPYLLQHQDNPVHWRPWGQAALAEARTRDKPILLSVGYAACHWCHVMAHESFEDDEVAALMNALFVNVKVDREERPDLDQIYQSSLQLLGEQGGWPLTMFLTPDGEPFWGGTYFPKTARFGRPGFKDVLRQVSEVYHGKADSVAKNAAELRKGLQGLVPDAPAAELSISMFDAVAMQMGRGVDPYFGGFGHAPKFPQCEGIEMLWRASLRTGIEAHARSVHLTLRAMCDGGIYDHLGGGFARYSVDEHWLVPHFEKMLYDNAQLVDILTLVWQGSGEPLYAQRVAETIDWLLREMRVEGAAFAGTLDADSEGEEGKFYVWTEAEIDAVIGANPAFKRAYDVTPHGNWEDKTILNRSRRHADDPDEAALAGPRALLLEARETRPRPGLDDKVMPDWNGLMIGALANAGAVFNRPDWIDAARAAFDFIREKVEIDGRLRHSWRAGEARHPGTLDDHAFMALAALRLSEASGDPAPVQIARDWVAMLDAHYWDAEGGGYFLAADDTTDVIVRAKPIHDASIPAGNGVMVEVLTRLWAITGDASYGERCDALIDAFSGLAPRQFQAMGSFLNAVAYRIGLTQIVLIGPAGAARDALRQAALSRSLPDRLLIEVETAEGLPSSHPASGKAAVEGAPAAFLCRGTTCSLPVTTAEALLALLDDDPGA